MSKQKITVLPYAGPEVMGNTWGNTIKSRRAGKKSMASLFQFTIPLEQEEIVKRR